MNHTVVYRRYYKKLPDLDRPPCPSTKSEDIYNNVSRRARDEWRRHQTMLISERHLNMVNVEDCKLLQQGMDKLLPDEDYAKANGYVPSSA